MEEQWKVNGYCIVSNLPTYADSEIEVDYYGGHLVCESVMNLGNAQKIIRGFELDKWLQNNHPDIYQQFIKEKTK